MIQVFLYDDHQLNLDGMQYLINRQQDMQCVGTARHREALLAGLAEQSRQLIVLVISTSDFESIESCRLVEQQFPACRVIGLSRTDEASFFKRMLKYGAQSCLLKNAGQQEVLKAIRRVHSGETYFSPGILGQLAGASSSRSNRQSGHNPLSRLSRREKEVLELIVQEYTSTEIGAQLFISPGTVETHRKHLLAKLNARNTAGLVRISMEYNLLYP